MSSPIVAFVSLFLSLTIGVQPVQVLVGEGVDRVELWLDYEQVGSMHAPNWEMEADFGQDLQPHLLEAIGYDNKGKELARAEQWINLPTPTADASLVIVRSPSNQGYIRLTWESVMGDEPERVALSMDGVPLDVTDPSRVPLPSYDADQLHFLRAELDFPSSVNVVKELTFGGSYGDELSTDLTALPIMLVGGREVPMLEVAEMQDWFLSNGRPVTVAAVDEGPAEITVIRDRGAQSGIERLAARGLAAIRFDAALKTEQNMAFFWPFLVQAPSGRWTFPPNFGWMSPADGGVPWFLASTPPPVPPDGRQLLADGVAVAGMNSLTRNRRRAVVLILGREPEDSSRLSPLKVLPYLESLRVPLYVWSPYKQSDSAWGSVRDVSSIGKFRAAVSDLAGDVQRQRIVWLQGRHLPQRVRLTDRVVTAGFPGQGE